MKTFLVVASVLLLSTLLSAQAVTIVINNLGMLPLSLEFKTAPTLEQIRHRLSTEFKLPKQQKDGSYWYQLVPADKTHRVTAPLKDKASVTLIGEERSAEDFTEDGDHFWVPWEGALWALQEEAANRFLQAQKQKTTFKDASKKAVESLAKKHAEVVKKRKTAKKDTFFLSTREKLHLRHKKQQRQQEQQQNIDAGFADCANFLFMWGLPPVVPHAGGAIEICRRCPQGPAAPGAGGPGTMAINTFNNAAHCGRSTDRIMAISYDPALLRPNFVAYRLTSAMQARDTSVQEERGFRSDPDMTGAQQAMNGDYNDPAFVNLHRGHMAPHSLLARWSKAASYAAGMMSNVAPMDACLNQRWSTHCEAPNRQMVADGAAGNEFYFVTAVANLAGVALVTVGPRNIQQPHLVVTAMVEMNAAGHVVSSASCVGDNVGHNLFRVQRVVTPDISSVVNLATYLRGVTGSHWSLP